MAGSQLVSLIRIVIPSEARDLKSARSAKTVRARMASVR
jgi:hypothetical protein